MSNQNDKKIKDKNKIPTIVHFEIPADDVERARKFYSTLFGWKIDKIEVIKPGAMRAGFEYYRAVFEDAQQNKEYTKEKLLDIPILTIGGEAGLGNFTTTSFHKVANNVTGMSYQIQDILF